MIRCARILFLVLVVFASFAYGLTREWAYEIFTLALGANVLLWLLGCAAARIRPQTGFLPWLFAGLILLYGWGIVLLGLAQAHLLTDPDFSLGPLDDFLFAANFFQPELSLPAMFRTTALLGGMLLAIDYFRTGDWGRALLLTLLATGLGMVLFFFLQKTFGGPFLLRSIDNRATLTFAVFRYWGNAAAYLNLLWPAAMGIAVHTAMRRARGWSIWLCVAIVLFSALFLNLSKAGHALGILGVIVLFVLILLHLRKNRRSLSKAISPGAVLSIGIPVILLMGILFVAIPWNRWDRLAESGLERNVRLKAYEHFLRIVPDAGWTGFGPGTFQKVYWPYIVDDRQMRKTPFWVAHQDYLQTAIEWGYCGTALWTLLLVPGGFLLLRGALAGSPGRTERTDFDYTFDLPSKFRAFYKAVPDPCSPVVLAGASVSVLLTALHALVDFPMQIGSIQFYFLLWIGLGWSTRQRKKNRPGSV